jgi:bifunctional UDP-N-acetylglucosamine pyrophosphorylase/glucosamine-1-phosphate N-acetyltransferase
MRSNRPKPIHPLCGRPMVMHVLHALVGVDVRRTAVVVGQGAEQVTKKITEQCPPTLHVTFVEQSVQRGTGDAVIVGLTAFHDDDDIDEASTIVVLNGDMPLLQASTIARLIERHVESGAAGTVLTAHLSDPTGYGRIVRGKENRVIRIVEQRDATPEERAIDEINTGVYCFRRDLLGPALRRLSPDNSQGEYYLTDVVELAVQDGCPVVAAQASEQVEVDGVNSPLQLAQLERAYQLRQARALMEQGVRLADPARFDVRGRLECGQDVEIDVNCVFEGHVVLGDDVRIGPNCVIANARIAAGAVLQAYTHIDGESAGVEIGEGALIGPFARLRPGARLGAEVHVGNFVEIKNSSLARGAKANHLAYLGDSVVGERVNYGAGSITANYDGANKHRTVIEADVHVGSNCVLVAPVTIAAGGTVGAGSVVNKDTEPGMLTVARARQVSITNWTRPKKNK